MKDNPCVICTEFKEKLEDIKARHTPFEVNGFKARLPLLTDEWYNVAYTYESCDINYTVSQNIYIHGRQDEALIQERKDTEFQRDSHKRICSVWRVWYE